MQLETPAETMPLTSLADWLEFAAWKAPNKEVSVNELWSAFDIASDAYESYEDEDMARDDLLSRASAEIVIRSDVLGKAYPFIMDKEGETLSLSPLLNLGQLAYLLCLRLSLKETSLIVGGPAVEDNERRLFQMCSTLCIAGHLGGPAISFGFPRPDHTGFLEKLQKIYPRIMPEGLPKEEPPAISDNREKDEGIDIIAFLKQVDNLPGTIHFFGQVASGANWKSKPLQLGTINKIFSKWFHEKPGSPAFCGMFIPFFPYAELYNTKGKAVFAQKLNVESEQYGIVYYRYRIARYVQEAFDLHASGKLPGPVDHINDKEQLVEWEQNFRALLLGSVHNGLPPVQAESIVVAQ